MIRVPFEKMREAVTVQQSTDVRVPATGGTTRSWATHSAPMVWVEGMTGTEARGVAAQLDATKFYRVHLRTVAGLTERMRIVRADGSMLGIISIDPMDPANRYTVLFCKEFKE